jgi:transcriptional regulator with XRE-family HTH domain
MTQKKTAAELVIHVANIRRRLPPPRMRRAIRESEGLSGAEIARSLNVAPQTISNWELGLRTPRGALLEAYVGVLDALVERQQAS